MPTLATLINLTSSTRPSLEQELFLESYMEDHLYPEYVVLCARHAVFPRSKQAYVAACVDLDERLSFSIGA